MSIRLISACVLSAWLAALASAQTTPGTLPWVSVPAPFPQSGGPARPMQATPVAGTPAPPDMVIEVNERPSFLPVPVSKTGTATHGSDGPAVTPIQAAPPQAPPPAPVAPTPQPAPPPIPPSLNPFPASVVAVPAATGVNTGLPTALFNMSPGPRPGRFWMDNEVLLWWIQGMRLPPLVTTSPPGVAPATAGTPTSGSSPVYGPGSEGNNLRVGYRLTVGGYLDDARRFALEANFFMTANGGNQFNASSPGDPIIVRPVINSTNQIMVGEPIAVPGVANGSIHIADRTTGILGAGVWLRESITRSDDPCDTCRFCAGDGGCGTGCCGTDPSSRTYCRFDSLFGYRYQRLSDNLEIDDTVNALVPLNYVPAGATLQRSDQFHTSNTFHGVDLGMTGEMMRGSWTVAATAKCAIGFNDSSVDVFGWHTVNGVPGLGGLLADPTNIGHFSHVLASAIPELDLKLGYSFSPTVRVFVGYSFMYWYHVTRAADEVNLEVNPTYLTRGAATASNPVAPWPIFADRSIWMQGLTLGFEWRY